MRADDMSASRDAASLVTADFDHHFTLGERSLHVRFVEALSFVGIQRGSAALGSVLRYSLRLKDATAVIR